MAQLVFNGASLLVPTRSSINKGGIGGKIIKRDKRNYVCSVDNLSLTIKNGDRVALIGQNGSGKSSLLRLAAGIYTPTSGSVSASGKIATLFSTTVGLSLEASAKNNIRDAAILFGIPKSKIDKLVEEIIEFSELQNFSDMPMRLYSSGMRARMGYGLATSQNSEILLIDEVFGTGDAKFYAKAKTRLEKKMEESCILLMATHSENIIKSFCNKAIWMHKGKLMGFGDVSETLENYKSFTLHE